MELEPARARSAGMKPVNKQRMWSALRRWAARGVDPKNAEHVNAYISCPRSQSARATNTFGDDQIVGGEVHAGGEVVI